MQTGTKTKTQRKLNLLMFIARFSQVWNSHQDCGLAVKSLMFNNKLAAAARRICTEAIKQKLKRANL